MFDTVQKDIQCVILDVVPWRTSRYIYVSDRFNTYLSLATQVFIAENTSYFPAASAIAITV